MKTKFRLRRDWPGWHPDRGALRAFVELIGTTWVEASSFSLELTRAERTDTAEDVADALQLLDSEAALAVATTIEMGVFGASGSLESMVFRWGGSSASLTVVGSDELIAEALRNKAGDILEAGSQPTDILEAGSQPTDILEAGSAKPQEPIALVAQQPLVRRETQLALAGVRFTGTYEAVHRLVEDLADQVRQVRGTVDLDFVYVVLTEPGTTLSVRDLSQLAEITRRDVHRLRHLTISLGSSPISLDGPSLSLYINHGRQIARNMSGNVSGPDEPAVRALRAAANDLLRDRGSFPSWMLWAASAIATVLEAAGIGLTFVDDVRPLGWALAGTGIVLSAHLIYLPQVELLDAGEKTRWSRWSRYIVGLVVIWLIGSLAVPLFAH